jgi:hypothetical protein
MDFIRGFPRHMVFSGYDSREQALLILHALHGARNIDLIPDEDVWRANAVSHLSPFRLDKL